MINHDKAQALISARYDELLSPADTRAVQEHLAACATCRQFAAETDLLANGLRTLPQLPPSPRVSRAVRDGIQSGGSPWGWLGHGLRIATSPALAVGSSLVLVAALAFIIVLALRPLGPEEQELATISALADVIETPTPTTEPEQTAITAPTMAPTEPAAVPPTQEPTAVPTTTPQQQNVAPPTNTPAPTAETASTAAPTQRSILDRAQATTVPAAETPPPTTAAPVATQAPTEPAPVATEPVTPAIDQSGDGAPFGSDQPVTAEAGADPPESLQPTIAPNGPGAVPALNPTATSDQETAPSLAAAAAEPTEPTEASVSTTTDDVARQPAETVAEPTAPPVAPTSTPVQIITASGPAAASGQAEPAPAPQLEERTGNEAIGMDADSMAAEIQATVQAGLNDDSGPPPVPTSAAPPVTPAPAAGDAPVIAPAGAEITGAPASDPLITEAAPPITDAAAAPPITDSAAAPPVTDGAVAGAAEITEITLAPAPTAIPEAVEPAPVAPQVVGAPEPGWPYIGGAGTQLLSNAGYSAIADGGGVSVYDPAGTPLGVVGSGVPIWSPGGTSLLMIGPDGLGAVWDANAGVIPVERPSAAARDIPVGWYDGSPLVQRVYFDGSGLVELRVVPVSGAAGYPIGTATTDSLFGEGVTAARLSPDGGQVSFYSGGQLYIAPVSDPGSATPAG